jgi:phenylalanyl-tRNA synthetase beta chain
MIDLCGARMAPGTLDEYPRPLESRSVGLRLDRVARLLGEEIASDQARAILERLGFEISGDDRTLTAVVPYWRDADVQREADLIEEVARVHGLDKLPTTLPSRRRAVGRLTREQRLRRRLEDLLRDRGLYECIAYAFTSPAALERLRLGDEPVLRIDNPLSEDLSVMRPLLLPGLLDAARHNAAHGRAGLALFEAAHVHHPAGPLEPPPEGSPSGALPASEPLNLSVLLTQAAPGGWRTPERPADFYAAKALLEALLGVTGIEWHAEPDTRPFLHPGRSALVRGADGHELGFVGELHPLVLREWDLEGPAAAFELDLDVIGALTAGALEVYGDVTSFPAVLQDIAVIVPDDVPASRVEETVRAGGGELLGAVAVFDLYRGEQVGEGNKSLALRLEFRAPDRTLTDEEVAERRRTIERELEAIGGRLRA